MSETLIYGGVFLLDLYINIACKDTVVQTARNNSFLFVLLQNISSFEFLEKTKSKQIDKKHVLVTVLLILCFMLDFNLIYSFTWVQVNTKHCIFLHYMSDKLVIIVLNR